MRKKKKLILSVGLIVVLLVILGYSLISNYQSTISVKHTMKFLTSNKCQGRITGTEGNKNAEKCFEKIGLEKYIGSYEFEYLHKG